MEGWTIDDNFTAENGCIKLAVMADTMLSVEQAEGIESREAELKQRCLKVLKNTADKKAEANKPKAKVVKKGR